MKVFKFMSGKNDEIWGVTQDQTAKNLPQELAPWHALGWLEVSPGQDGLVGANSEEILTAINQKGFFLSNVK
ncbi:MAG TPA: hypothetical protein VMU16_12750 [Candidatus Binataceae bacterium]|nr:hypothetical protein [Candidatus Binataceae bacterium]